MRFVRPAWPLHPATLGDTRSRYQNGARAIEMEYWLRYRDRVLLPGRELGVDVNQHEHFAVGRVGRRRPSTTLTTRRCETDDVIIVVLRISGLHAKTPEVEVGTGTGPLESWAVVQRVVDFRVVILVINGARNCSTLWSKDRWTIALVSGTDGGMRPQIGLRTGGLSTF